MAVDRGAIVARVPELKAVSDPTQWSAAITDAKALVSEAAWGALYEPGVCYLAAHFLLCSNPKLAPAEVSSESIGGVSRSYAVAAAPARGNLASTVAGITYLRLRRQLPGFGAMVV